MKGDLQVSSQQEVGDLQLMNMLMNGAQATVYRGVLKRSQSESIEVAVKVFQDPRDKESEKKMLKQLQQIDGVVRLIDYPLNDGIVLELLSQDLFELTGQYDHALPLQDVQDIGRQILQTLAKLHEMGITHYDIKPENIMAVSSEKQRIIQDPVQIALTGSVVGFRLKDTRVRLIDFAFADHGEQVCGTQTYYPPEQLAQQSGVVRQFGPLPHQVFRITPKVDIWALACVMFELYTKIRIFDQNNDTRRFAAITDLTSSISDVLGDHYLPANTRQQIGVYTMQHLSKGKDLKLRMRVIDAINLIRDHVPSFYDFLKCALQYNPANRKSAEELLNHAFIQQRLPAGYQDMTTPSHKCQVCKQEQRRLPKIHGLCNTCSASLCSFRPNTQASEQRQQLTD